MTTYTKHSVNNNGIAQIAAFLLKNHKRGEIISQDPAMLGAWAADAEFSLSEGNGADIEIRAFDSVLGRTQNFTITTVGLDSTEVEIDE